MRGRFASHRFRRRAAWVATALAVAGVVAFLGIRFENTGHKIPQKFTNKPVQRVAPEPKADPFTPVERSAVRAVATRFIRSAVYRQNVDDSWGITTAQLHQGLTRSAWAKGSIPVVPYAGNAVAQVRWKLDFSYPNQVGLKVAFYPKPASGVDRQVFEIELENHGTDSTPNWLVSYWAPSGGPQLQNTGPGGPPISIGTPRGNLGAVWLIAPFGVIVGVLVGLVAFLVVRGRVRRVRAQRLYNSSSSPS
jgi:hypothetical protein